MCTRFYMEKHAAELRPIVERAKKHPLTERFLCAGGALVTEGEVRPTSVAAAIAPNSEGLPAVYPMKWGFNIPGAGLVLNARSESAKEKASFREAWERHRCIIPASYYFEWEHIPGENGKMITGDKYAIQPRDAGVTWLCGLYRIENGLPRFVILTREPSESVRKIHNRMPMILPRSSINDWINPRMNADSMRALAITDLVAEKA